MSSEPINIEIRDKVGSGIATKIRDIASASREASSSLDKLKAQLSQLNTSGLNKLKQAIDNSTTSITKNQLASEKLALITQKLASEEARTATRVAQAAAAQDRAALAALRLEQAKKRVEQQAQRSGNAIMGFVRNLAAFIGVGLGVQAIIGAADAYTVLQNKLRNVTDTQEQLAEVTGRVFDIAKETRTPVEATAQAFQRFDLAMKNLGASQEESLRLTETINKAIKVSGATTEESAAALLQLSQAFNKGKLDGDEFRTVMELMPAAADAIAKQLKVTRGDLLKLAPEGKITAEVMRQAFANLANEIDNKFAKTVPTIGEALGVLRTNATQFFGELNANYKITSTIASAIITLANNFDVLAVAITGVGAAMLVTFGPAIISAIGSATAAVWAFTAALAMNPIGLIVVAVTTAISAFFFFGKEILAAGDKLSIFGITATDVFLGMGDAAKGIFDGVVNALYAMVAKMIVGIKGMLEYINTNLPESMQLSIKTLDPSVYKLAGQSVGQAFAKGFVDAQNTGLVAQYHQGTLFKPASAGLNAGKPSSLRPAGPGQASTLPDEKAMKAAERRSFELKKVNNELDSQLKLMQQVGFASEVEQEMTKITNQLFDKKITLTKAESEAIREKVTQLQYEKGVHSELEKIYDSTQGKQLGLTQQIEALNQAYQRGIVTLDDYNNRMVKIGVEAANLNMQMNGLNFGDFATASLGRLVEQYQGVAAGLTDAFGSFFQSFSDGFADSVGRAIVYGDDLQTSLSNVARSILSELISALIKVGIQYAVNAAIAQTSAATEIAAVTAKSSAQIAATAATTTASTAAMATTTAASTANAAATTTAWAPAAAFASIGSFGTAAVVALGAIAAVLALTRGFKEGGYTGNVGTSDVAGVVHGKEFVFDAAATQRIGVGNLEAIRNGASYNSGSSSKGSGFVQSNIQVNITNQIPDAEYQVSQVSPGQVEIIARRIVREEAPGVIAGDLGSANSRTSKALSKNTTTQRKRT